MKPPPQHPDLQCGCLHCGQEGHTFTFPDRSDGMTFGEDGIPF